MPFLYASHSKQAPLENFSTNGTANTELDFFFMKAGSTRPAAIVAMRVQGKGAGLTALSGISVRLKTWTSTSSTSVGGTSTTPAPKNKLSPACVATAGMATAASSTITSGTGGPNIVGMASMGASGPGGWVAVNPDDLTQVDGGANMSMDLFSSSPTANLSFEFEVDNSEC
jgi:hypothetical protein